RVLYAIFRPFVPIITALFPKQVTTTERVGRAILAVARGGHPKAVLENADIDASGAGRTPWSGLSPLARTTDGHPRPPRGSRRPRGRRRRHHRRGSYRRHGRRPRCG